MFTPFDGVAVVVTGGTRGIGRGIATCFAEAGAKVLVTGRDKEAAERLVEEVPGTSYVLADVSTAAGSAAMTEAARDLLGGIDVLCANAGIFPAATIAELTEEMLDDTLNVNLKGTILSVRAALPLLERSARGRIVVTSSITGHLTGFPGLAHYGASKAGQIGFVRTAAVELAGKGITVNAVLPGGTVTDGMVAMGDDLDEMALSNPLKRLGRPADIGYAALFLASAEAGYITGQTLVVDGGQVLPELPI